MTTSTAVPAPRVTLDPTPAAALGTSLTTDADGRTLEVEVWSDIACPWCYLGKRRYEAALAGFEHRAAVRTVWRSYELSPDTPTGPGVPEIEALARSKGIDAAQVRQMFDHVAQVAAQDGIQLDFATTLAVNTFDAHRLVHLAAEAGGDVLAGHTIEVLYAAHFTQGLDLGLTETLVGLAAAAGFDDCGLDADAVRGALTGTDGAAQVRQDEDEARALGVQGVPFFVVDRRLAVSGAQPVEVFTQLLERGWLDGAAPARGPGLPPEAGEGTGEGQDEGQDEDARAGAGDSCAL